MLGASLEFFNKAGEGLCFFNHKFPCPSYPNHFPTVPYYELTFSQKKSYPHHISPASTILCVNIETKWKNGGKQKNSSSLTPAKRPSCAYYNTDSR